MRPLARGYVLAMVGLGASILLWALTSLPTDRATLPIFAILVVSAATAQLFPVVTPRNQAYQLTPAFVFGGIFLLPPSYVALLVVLAFLPEWIKARKSWYVQLFNIANTLLDTFAARAAYSVIAGPHTAPLLSGSGSDSLDGALELVAALAAAAIFTLLNHVFLSLVLRLARGHSWRDSRLLDTEYYLIDATLACMGIFPVLLWQTNPWFVALVVPPLFLSYQGLKTPHLQEQARTDSKTGLYNARHLQEALRDELRRAARFDRPLAVIMADMDLLRTVNNRYGHLAGDVVLEGVASIIKRCLRDYDLAARFGGEEFAILLPETGPEQAFAVAERIRDQVASARFVVPTSDPSIQTTLSLGVATFPVDGWDPDEILHQADLAVYHAKLEGRNQVRCSSSQSRSLGPLMASEPSRLEPQSAAVPSRPQMGEQGPADATAVAPPDTHAVAAVDTVRAGAPQPREDHAKPDAGQPEGRESRRQRSGDLTLPLALVIGAVLATTVTLWIVVRPWEQVLDWFALGVLYALATVAQSLAIEIYGRGRISTSAILILAGGFIFGMPAALVMAPVVPVTIWVKNRGVLHRALFDLGDTALSAAAAAFVYQRLAAPLAGTGPTLLFVPACVAAIAYYGVNVGLISIAIGLSEGRFPVEVWKEKFRWLFPHYLVFGMLAMFMYLAYQSLGFNGLLAFFIPPLMLRNVMKQYLDSTEKNVAELRRVNRDLVRANEDVVSTLQKLGAAYGSTLRALSAALDSRDSDTEGHSQRVVAYAEAIARRIGLSDEDIATLRNGAILHDVGKIGVPDAILRKPGLLTPAEQTIMRTHPDIGFGMLESIDFLKSAAPMVRHHHERYDGTGYPKRLKGEEIPIGARIFAVADSFDAMTSDRPYRPASSIEEALQELSRFAGSQFDPQIVEAFLKLSPQELAELANRRSPLNAALTPEAPAETVAV